MSLLRLLRGCLLSLAGLLPGAAAAHFQEILPSADVLPEGGAVSLSLVFTHPMEGGPVMPMARPVAVGMKTGTTITDLLPALTEAPVDGAAAWRVSASLPEPGAGRYIRGITMIPSRTATDTASSFEWTCSFSRMRCTWFRTVCTLR